MQPSWQRHALRGAWFLLPVPKVFMGNSSLQGGAPQVRLFANDRVWIEDAAVQQLHTTARLPHMRAAVGLPDLHPGRGYPVGAAFFTVGHLYPALVGGDIGCGMALWRTGLRTHKVSPSGLEKQLGSIDGPLPDALMDDALAQLRALPTAPLPATEAMLAESLGTIGGGNHFAELQVVDAVYDASGPHRCAQGRGGAAPGPAGRGGEGQAAPPGPPPTPPAPPPPRTATGSPSACCARCAPAASACWT